MVWKAKTLTHKKEKRIAVYFKKDANLIARIKQLDGARWSQSLLAWHIPDTDQNRIRFKLETASNCLPSPEGIAQIEKFKLWLRSKRYSENTISTYCDALRSFFVFYKDKAIVEIDNADVIVYNNEYILENKL